jgi:hypothetical protein
MSDRLVLASSCDRLFGTDIFGFLPTTVAAGGVSGNGFQFGQTGGLSGGFFFGTGTPYNRLFTGCHGKFTTGTGFGAPLITHGGFEISEGLGTFPRRFSACGFNNIGRPYVVIGSSVNNPRFDETDFFVHPNTWYYVELETEVSATPNLLDPDNFIDVKAKNRMFVDGREAIEMLEEFTFAQTIPEEEGGQIVRVGITGLGSSTMVDNIYIGTTRLGAVRAQRYMPTADGSLTEWTPSSSPPGDLYVEIDETGAVNYTDHIYTETVGDRASFTFGPISGSVTEILGGDWNQISGGLEDSSPTEIRAIMGFVITGSPATRYDLTDFSWPTSTPPGQDSHFGFLINPATGLNFTREELESSGFGFEMTL